MSAPEHNRIRRLMRLYGLSEERARALAAIIWEGTA